VGIVDEGGAHSVQKALMVQTHPSRDRFKDMHISELFNHIESGRENEAIAFLRNYKLQDLAFLKGLIKPGKTVVT
jgi:hypothetical protein